MGTTGFVVTRHRGKYYITCRQQDSYPDGLGNELVSQIPTDHQGYQVWLTQKRAFYSEIEQRHEDVFLTISDDSLPDCKEIGDELIELPSPFPGIFGTLVDWTYIIDLDEEILSISGAHFKLDRIPRDDLWIKALKNDIYGRITLSTRICPADCMACPAICSKSDKIFQSYAREFRGFSRSVRKAKTSLDMTGEGVHDRIFRGYTLCALFERYREHLITFALRWSPDAFGSRELLFAIVCLAAGEVRYHRLPQDFRHRKIGCGRIVVDEGQGIGGSKVLPEFAFGSHQREGEPGSAPRGTAYWFEDVFVSLAACLDVKSMSEAAIGRAVTLGMGDRSHFHAVILSLSHVILVEVSVENKKTVVTHTEPILLFPIPLEEHVSTHPRERPPVEKRSGVRRPEWIEILESDIRYREPQGIFARFPGFMSLMRLWEAAASWRLKPFRNHGPLPAEINYQILDNTDDQTYRSCAKVCWPWRQYCQKNLRIGAEKVLLKHEKRMTFSFKDRQTGTEEVLKLVRGQDRVLERSPIFEQDCLRKDNWSPIVGSDRPSILSEVSLNFEPPVDQKSLRAGQKRSHDQVHNTET